MWNLVGLISQRCLFVGGSSEETGLKNERYIDLVSHIVNKFVPSSQPVSTLVSYHATPCKCVISCYGIYPCEKESYFKFKLCICVCVYLGGRGEIWGDIFRLFPAFLLSVLSWSVQHHPSLSGSLGASHPYFLETQLCGGGYAYTCPMSC